MDLQQELSNIAKDITSGSAAIVKQVEKAVFMYCNIEHYIDADFLIKKLMEYYHKSDQFAVLYHFINTLFLWLEKESNEKGKIKGEDVIDFLEDYNYKWNNAQKGIAKNLILELQQKQIKKLLLHSNSSTITEAFKEVQKKNPGLEIIQTLSEPNKEGKLQAKLLAEMGFKVHFIVDAFTGQWIPKADACILGADVIFTDVFINKIGSFSIAALCRHLNKPCYVLADSRKIVADKVNKEIQQNMRNERAKSKDEVWENAPANVIPVNYYFEEIPNAMVNAFITEKSVLTVNELFKDNLLDMHSGYFR